MLFLTKIPSEVLWNFIVKLILFQGTCTLNIFIEVADFLKITFPILNIAVVL